MKPAALRQIIADGESLQVEFKGALSSRSPRAICKEIAALATCGGGILIIGVKDDKTILGLESPLSVRDQIERWVADAVFPTPVIDLKVMNFSDKKILVIRIENTDFPVFSFDQKYYQRVGTSSVPVPPEKMVDLIRGRPIEAILKSIEANVSATQSNVAVAQSMANVAMVSVAPAIIGQGDLATLNYRQILETLIHDLSNSSLIKSLESGVALAQSLASVAVSSVSPAIHGQGDLATSNYDTIRKKLLDDFDPLYSTKSIESRCLALEALLSTARVSNSILETRVANLEAKLMSLAS